MKKVIYLLLVSGVLAFQLHAQTKFVKVNFYNGINSYNNSEWNNLSTDMLPPIGFSNLRYSDGSPSFIDAGLTHQTSIGDNGPSYTTTMAPQEVCRYASYSTLSRALVIGGLDNSKIYSLEIYATRNGQTNNTTRFTNGSTIIDILTDNNAANKAVFTNLSPVSGVITVGIQALNTYNYINGFILTEAGVGPSNPAPTAYAGDDETITLPVNSIQLSGSGFDENGTIVSYHWDKIAGPSQYFFSSVTAPNPTLFFLLNGTYTFRLTVTDQSGAASFDDVNITVNVETTYRFIKVNIYGGLNPYNHPEWNNWNTFSSLSASLKYADGTPSPISATLSHQRSIADCGPNYPTTMVSPKVGRYASYDIAVRTLILSGLDDGKIYDLEIYATRKGTSNNMTRFTLPGSYTGHNMADILTDNNLSEKALFTSIQPSSGQIIVSIYNFSSFNYINGFMLTEHPAALVVNNQVNKNAPIKKESEATNAFNIFPNPVRDQFVVSLTNIYVGRMNVQVIDSKGAVVKQFSLTKSVAGHFENQLSIAELKPGEYIIRVQRGDIIETKKVIKIN